MNQPAIPENVLAIQREASDPSASAWVSANAGSGKTFVLTQRVIRLLLRGTDPAKILCLTFTKAAAANMATGVFKKLAAWTALDDAGLDAAIRAISNEKPDAKLRARARRLFAQALETPGGLKVQTIHAFCTRLLHQFPFEANVAARFEVLDDATQRQLLEQSSLGVVLEAAAKPDAPLGQALAKIITSATDQSFKDALNEAIGKRDDVVKWIEKAGSIGKAVAELSRALGVDPSETSESVEAQIVDSPIFPASAWASVAALCKASSSNDQKQCERLSAAAAASGTARVKAYLSVFLTGDLQPRKSIITGPLAKRYPELAESLAREQNRVSDLLAKRAAVAARDRTGALLTLTVAVLERYRREKDRRALLDYDDIIEKTLALMNETAAAWVHYKLDLGIDHVLIDEAQDTSPKQWEIISRLTAEFAAGAGARLIERSIFAVGDDKQSIFSFQGAVPEAFAEKRREFKRGHDESGLEFRPLEFKYSFRSAPVVLQAVDAVFRQPEAFRGLTGDAVQTVHEAVRTQAPGVVEIWEPIVPDDKPEIEGWDAPFDTTSETSPRVKLARRIAAQLRADIAAGAQVGDGAERHAMRPGDVLVLVRQRGPLFEAIIRALKTAGIAVAGADRLILIEHIAVMDLLVLADALLLPDDDLGLATVLKSPLFGYDDDKLFALAWNRKGSLRAALAEKDAETCARLDRLAEAARRKTPFAFYAYLLGPERGRHSFLARLGAEVTDALDEFLNLALDYERHETPSLQGFVSWLRSTNAEVKRDMEISRDEVRVMTVHGAKGLEAPVVVLADTCTLPAGPPQRQPRVLPLPLLTASPGSPNPLVWAGRKDDDTPPVAAARMAAANAAENEYRRLLYVAMTRAADRLIICGAAGARGRPPGCWYDLVWNALAPISLEQENEDGKIWHFRKGAAGDADGAATTPATLDTLHAPAWLRQPAPRPAAAARLLSPSHAYDEDSFSQPSLQTSTPLPNPPPQGGRGLARGRLLHRLMQSLPDVPPAHRAEAAQRYLARAGREFTEAERTTMAAQALRVLDDARFAALFAPGSRAEVPIVGRLRHGEEPVVVSGQIDRLAVTGDAVLIGDYKTNRPPPLRLEDVPPAYVAQLALYRAVLAPLYPGKAIRAALIWTETPDIMEIPGPALDAALTLLGRDLDAPARHS
jgi:ATP-dependent helicase/nuclease subunit A